MTIKKIKYIHYSQNVRDLNCILTFIDELNVTFCTLLNAHTFCTSCCSLTRSLTAKQVFDPINILVQLELVFKQPSSSCCSHCDIMGARRHLTIDQQYLAIVRLQTGCSQTDVATELRVSSAGCNRDSERLRESQKGIEVDVLWPHPTLMTDSL